MTDPLLGKDRGMTTETYLIRVSADLLSQLGTRTEDGRRITAEWGEPVQRINGENIYEPTFTAHDDPAWIANLIAHHSEKTL